MEVDELERMYQRLKSNYHEFNESNKTLYEPVDYEEWIYRFQLRAANIQRMFRENNSCIEKIKSAFMQGELRPEMLPDEHMKKCYQKLFDIAEEIYYEDTCDVSFLRLVTSILCPYFEMYGDIVSMIKVYLWTGYAYIELSRTGDETSAKTAMDYYKKVLKYQNNKELWAEGNGNLILVAYNNLLLSGLNRHYLTFEEGFELYDRYNELIQTERCKKETENNERTKWYIDHMDYYFVPLLIGTFFNRQYHVYNEENPLDQKIISIGKEYFKEQLEDPETEKKLDNLIYAYYLYLKIILNLVSWKEAFFIMYEKICEKYDSIRGDEEESYETLESLFNPIELSILMMDYSDISNEEKNKYVLKLIHIVTELANRFEYGHNTFSLNDALSRFAEDIAAKDYISDKEKKIQLLKELSITRYISTYIHSLMVAKLCKVYLKYVILEKPETLIGVMDCKTAEEVQDRKSELEEFFWNGALLHDIGKNDMIDIISTEYRKLDDNEFGIIRKHPERGAKILEGEEQFESFISLILGHHRSYDGRRGYPMDFDNASSSWKPLIDILTLCDCMEAATDFLSRNYERTKTPDAVLGEFETGAGTFYNPVYVELLKENHQLFKEISEIVGKGRFRTYYEIYKDHFERKDEK